MQTATREAEAARPAARREIDASGHLSAKTLRRFATVAVLMLAAYLVGAVPGWLSARGYELEISELRRQNRISSIRTSLAEAALNANRGEFEEARRDSSDFFTKLRAELDSDDSVIDAAGRDKVRDILSQRDEVITRLARGNRDAGNVLTAWYFVTRDLK